MNKRRGYLETWPLPGATSSETSDSGSSGVVSPVVTSGGWVAEYKRYLTEEEALQNAQKVAYHFPDFLIY